MYIATYWLAKDIYNYSKEYNYLKNNNRVKTANQEAPFYDRDLIHYVKTQNPNITKFQNEAKPIHKSILPRTNYLWGNLIEE